MSEDVHDERHDDHVCKTKGLFDWLSSRQVEVKEQHASFTAFYANIHTAANVAALTEESSPTVCGCYSNRNNPQTFSFTGKCRPKLHKETNRMSQYTEYLTI